MKPKAGDYPNIKFWYRTDFTKSVDKEKKLTQVVKKKQPGALDSSRTSDSDDVTILDPAPASGKKAPRKKPVINEGLRYLEHSDGRPFLPSEISQLSGFSRSLWFGLKGKCLAPQRWGHASSDVLSEYYTKVSHQLPELSLCDNNWKLQLYATQTYPSWAANHLRNSDTIKIKSEPKSELEAETAIPPALSVPTKTSTKRPRLESLGSSSYSARPIQGVDSDVTEMAVASLLELGSSPHVISSPTQVFGLNSGDPHGMYP